MGSSSLCPHLLQEYFKRISEISDTYKSQIVKFVDYGQISDSLLNRKILRPEEHEFIHLLQTNEKQMTKALEIFEKRMWGLENLISVLIEVNVDSWLVEEMFQKYVHHIVNEIRRLQSLKSCRCFENERRSFFRRAVIRFFERCDEWLFDIGTSLGCLDQTIFPTRNALQPINNLLPIPRHTEETITLPSIDSEPFNITDDSEEGVRITEVLTDSDIPSTLRQIEGQKTGNSTNESASASASHHRINPQRGAKTTSSSAVHPPTVIAMGSTLQNSANKPSDATSKPSRVSPKSLASRDATSSTLKAATSTAECEGHAFVSRNDITFNSNLHLRNTPNDQSNNVVYVPVLMRNQFEEGSYPNELNGQYPNNYFILQPVPNRSTKPESDMSTRYSPSSEVQALHFRGHSSPVFASHDNLSFTANTNYNLNENKYGMHFNIPEGGSPTRKLSNSFFHSTGSLTNIPEETYQELNPGVHTNPVVGSAGKSTSGPQNQSSSMFRSHSFSESGSTGVFNKSNQRQAFSAYPLHSGSKASTVESTAKVRATKSVGSNIVSSKETNRKSGSTVNKSPATNKLTSVTSKPAVSSKVKPTFKASTQVTKKNQQPIAVDQTQQYEQQTSLNKQDDESYANEHSDSDSSSTSQRSDDVFPETKNIAEPLVDFSTVYENESLNDETAGYESEGYKSEINKKLHFSSSDSENNDDSDAAVPISKENDADGIENTSFEAEVSETNNLPHQLLQPISGEDAELSEAIIDDNSVSDPLHSSHVSSYVEHEVSSAVQKDPTLICQPNKVSEIQSTSIVASASTVNSFNLQSNVQHTSLATETENVKNSVENLTVKDSLGFSLTSPDLQSELSIPLKESLESSDAKATVENISGSAAPKSLGEEGQILPISYFTEKNPTENSGSVQVERSEISVEKMNEDEAASSNDILESELKIAENEESISTEGSPVPQELLLEKFDSSNLIQTLPETILLKSSDLTTVVSVQDILNQHSEGISSNSLLGTQIEPENSKESPTASVQGVPDKSNLESQTAQSSGQEYSIHTESEVVAEEVKFIDPLVLNQRSSQEVESSSANSTVTTVLTEESKAPTQEENNKEHTPVLPHTSDDKNLHSEANSNKSEEKCFAESTLPKNARPKDTKKVNEEKPTFSPHPLSTTPKKASGLLNSSSLKDSKNKPEVTSKPSSAKVATEQKKASATKEPPPKTVSGSTPKFQKVKQFSTPLTPKTVDVTKKKSEGSLAESNDEPIQNKKVNLKSKTKSAISNMIARLTKPTTSSEKKSIKAQQPDKKTQVRSTKVSTQTQVDTRGPSSDVRKTKNEKASKSGSQGEAASEDPMSSIPLTSTPTLTSADDNSQQHQDDTKIKSNSSCENNNQNEVLFDGSSSSGCSVNSSMFDLSMSDAHLDFQFDEHVVLRKGRLDKLLDIPIPLSPCTQILTPALRTLTASIISGRRHSALPAPIELVTDHWIFTSNSNPSRSTSDPVLSLSTKKNRSHGQKKSGARPDSKNMYSQNESVPNFNESNASVKTGSSSTSLSTVSASYTPVLVDASSQTEMTPKVSTGRMTIAKSLGSPSVLRKASSTDRKDVSAGSPKMSTRKSLTSGGTVTNPKPIVTGSNSSDSGLSSSPTRRKVAPVTPTRPVWSNKKPSPQPSASVPERFTQFSIEDYNFQQWANEWTSRQEKKKNATQNA